MMTNEVLHKEIDLIQGCINRMANNSFLLKGWLISIIAVVLAIAKADISLYHYCFMLIPIVSFWYLDAYFLRMERLYRKLYEWVIKERENSSEYLYDLDTTRFSKQVGCVFNVMLSKTLVVFYVGLIIFLILLVFFIV